MYDLKSDIKEFVAETPAAARAKAVSFFGIEESEITFHELATTEVAGAGARVVIVAQPTEMVGQTVRSGGDGGRGSARERPSRDRDRGGDRDRGSGRERSGRGRGDRESRPPRGERDREPRAPRAERDREPRAPRAERNREPRAPRAERNREPRPAPDEPSVGTVSGDPGPVGEFILGVIERMDLGPFEVAGSEEGRFMVYQLAGAAAEELTAADGRAIEAIQLLANQAAGRLSDDPKRIVVDAEGDRERREDFLGRMAERAARRAKDTGRSVALDPMNGRDRRGIHIALREMEGVATMSVGEGLYRQVVVVPEGADEYEEAMAGSPDSASDTQETQED
jgi:spoIIIJ-associated protein